MNDIKIFENKEFGKIRVQEINNEVWFVAKDVCEALALTNTTMVINRLDEDERTKFNLGRQGETNFVNEYGLYNLVLASRKSEAKEFKRWITHEVLPSIRKNGGYIQNQENLSDSELMAKALLVADKQIKERNRIIEEQKPKVELADTFIKGNGTVLVSELAVILQQKGRRDIGELKLFNYLRNNGYLSKQRGREWNKPTNKGMELGLFKIKQTEVIHRNGYIEVSITPLVTAKGQNYFINKFIIKGEVL